MNGTGLRPHTPQSGIITAPQGWSAASLAGPPTPAPGDQDLGGHVLMGAGRSPLVTGGARSKTLGQLAPSICGVLTQEGVWTPVGVVTSRGRRRPLGLGGAHHPVRRVSQVAQSVNDLPAMQETWAPSLGWEAPLEKEMATRSSIFAWRIPWMEEPGGLYSPRGHRVRDDGVTKPPPPPPVLGTYFFTW